MQEAEKRGLNTSEDYKSQLELARQTLLIRELFADYQKKNPVTDAEIKAEYDKFAAANSGKEYRAAHILVDKEDEAKAIIARLKKGEKFDAIAKKSSKDPGSGAKGGDLDWANPASYVPEFSQVLVKLNKGQLTDTPVKSQFGYHIIRLDDTREAKLPPLAEVKAQVGQQLQQQKLAKYQEEIRAKGQSRIRLPSRANKKRGMPRFFIGATPLQPAGPSTPAGAAGSSSGSSGPVQPALCPSG